jgi:hypothetical protein
MSRALRSREHRFTRMIQRRELCVTSLHTKWRSLPDEHELRAV